MEISDEMIEYIATLARLNLTEQRKHGLKKDLEGILGYVEILKELDLSGEEPLSHAFGEVNRFREDDAHAPMNRDLLLSNAPQQKEGCFQVPKTVE